MFCVFMRCFSDYAVLVCPDGHITYQFIDKCALNHCNLCTWCKQIFLFVFFLIEKYRNNEFLTMQNIEALIV